MAHCAVQHLQCSWECNPKQILGSARRAAAALKPSHEAFGPAALCMRCLLDELLERAGAPPADSSTGPDLLELVRLMLHRQHLHVMSCNASFIHRYRCHHSGCRQFAHAVPVWVHSAHGGLCVCWIRCRVRLLRAACRSRASWMRDSCCSALPSWSRPATLSRHASSHSSFTSTFEF